jgi:squalene cyclase
MKIPKEKIAQSQLQKYVATDGKIALKELRRLSQNIQRASEFIFSSQEENG